MLTFGTILKENAVKFKDKPAVIFQEKHWTYSEINRRANQIANAFILKGYKKGDRVSILMKNNAAYIELIVGLSKIGVTIVPINFRLVGSEIEYIAENSQSRGFITTDEYASEIEALIPKLPQLDTIVVIGKSSSNNVIEYKKFIATGSTKEPNFHINENDTLYLGYTSGTTGKPKGVVISHRSRVLTGIVAAYEYKIDESDVHIVAGPIYHAAPWIFLMMQLIVGGTLIIEESFRPEQFLAEVEKYKATNAFMTPTMFNFLVNLDKEIQSKYDTSSLRVLISAGAPLPTQTKIDILGLFPNVDLHEFYGSTESAITLNIKPKDIRRKDSCVGRPFPFVECLILDDNKKPVAIGEVGELYFKSPYLLEKYLNNEKATEDSFWNEYFTVGDLALQDEEGFYYIIDRKKDMLISGGVNIYPKEIENVLYYHPDILDVAVIGVPDPVWGETVKAIVVPKEGTNPSSQDIIAFCKDKLASYKKPKSVDFVKELPRTPSGKILKVELRLKYREAEQSREV